MSRGHGMPAFLLAVIVSLAIGWLAYAPASSADFGLDDVTNLDWLARVADGDAAVAHVFAGDAGPLGRPIALASFVPQADAWSDGASSFLAVNVLIHLANGALLAAVLALLAGASGIGRSRSLVVAAAATAIWLLMPVLAPASLNVVQRMTTLSGTFVLAALFAYLLARRHIESSPRGALAGMSAALVLGTVLAVLTKENGALLPTFALVMEVTLLARPAAPGERAWRAWTAVFLWLPTALVCGYLLTYLPYPETVVLKRDFTALERLMSEAVILWDYLVKAFVPLPGAVTAYNDHQPVARSLFDPVTFLAVLGWVVVFATAVVRRRRNPLLAFAALWYLAGHLVESTVLPLELYFDHRNYLPLIGPVYALAAGTASLSERGFRLAGAGLAAYAAVLAFSLFSLTTLWGQPAVAAQYWYERAPGSVRAATRYADRLLRGGDSERAFGVIRDHVVQHPEDAYVLIQMLAVDCAAEPTVDRRRQVDAVANALASVDFTYTVIGMLESLQRAASRNACAGIDSASVRRLADALAANPRYAHDRAYLRAHYQFKASTWFSDGDLERALEALGRVPGDTVDADLAGMNILVLTGLDRYDAAREYLHDARQRLPSHPMKRQAVRRELDKLDRYVETLRGRAGESTAPAPADQS